MKLYPLLRFVLFLLEPERAHHVSLVMMSWLNKLGLLRLFFGRTLSRPVSVMGITFQNSVGLAAGLDKNGDYINALSSCGFGFIEIGTVTPVAQEGNPQPRLFRLIEDKAIINRMGFNNKGVDYLCDQVVKSNPNCVLGINIGKNKSTENADAVKDYLACFKKVYSLADYITINISSPNTPGLRELQSGEALKNLLQQLKQEQAALHVETGRYVPLVVKIAPDLELEEIKLMAKTLLDVHIDGVIATNTTNQRPETLCSNRSVEVGGLSGAPLTEPANILLTQLHSFLGGQIPIIASGGVMSQHDVQQKLRLGASLVQIYSGFIYHGPRLIHDSVKSQH